MTVTDDRPEDSSEPEPEPVANAEPGASAASSIRSGQRLDKLAELEEERRYLLRSLKDLENERAAGDVDDDDYETLKDGYTVRAASVLRQIENGRRALAPKVSRNWKRTIVVSLAVVAFSVAVAAALASAFGERGADDEITGFNPGDDTRTTLASARAALGGGDFVRAQELFIRADQEEIVRGNDNAEARTYVGWTTALVARSAVEDVDDIDEDQVGLSLLALNQAISIDPTFADPYCFVAIIEFNFRGDADAALPFVEECESRNPPADVAGFIEEFGARIRAATDG
ncbi:MAG: hypothetical protein WA964_00345 [Ilumatobacter sp.]|uniref:hypothetical protein n=1 Tax=Ilumatobacter sp. TaxID=1967498 RepID=UPI003C711020